MKVTKEPLENRQVHLIVEVDEEQIQQAMRRVARRIARETSFPGFRKGKAPYELVVRRYGEDAIRAEAIDTLAETAYREAVEQEDVTPFSTAELEDVKLEPLTFTFKVPLFPELDLGDYRDYRREPPEVEISAEEVQQALDQVREQNAILELAEHPASKGDGVLIDVVGRTIDGEEFLSREDMELFLEAEEGEQLTEVAAAIVGMEAGEERTLVTTLPEDFPREDLRGEEAEYIIKLKEVYDRMLPEVDDDLARTIGHFDSLEELKEHFRERLRAAAERKAEQEYTEQVVDDIVQQARLEYPPVLLEKELDGMVKEFEQTVRRRSKVSLEDYLHLQGKTMDQLREELEPLAAVQLRRAMVLGEVVRQEELELDEEELDAEIEEISKSWGPRAGDVRASLRSEAGHEGLRGRLLGQKALERLVAIARGEGPAKKEETQGPESEETEVME